MSSLFVVIGVIAVLVLGTLLYARLTRHRTTMVVPEEFAGVSQSLAASPDASTEPAARVPAEQLLRGDCGLSQPAPPQPQGSSRIVRVIFGDASKTAMDLPGGMAPSPIRSPRLSAGLARRPVSSTPDGMLHRVVPAVTGPNIFDQIRQIQEDTRGYVVVGPEGYQLECLLAFVLVSVADCVPTEHPGIHDRLHASLTREARNESALLRTLLSVDLPGFFINKDNTGLDDLVQELLERGNIRVILTRIAYFSPLLGALYNAAVQHMPHVVQGLSRGTIDRMMHERQANDFSQFLQQSADLTEQDWAEFCLFLLDVFQLSSTRITTGIFPDDIWEKIGFKQGDLTAYWYYTLGVTYPSGDVMVAAQGMAALPSLRLMAYRNVDAIRQLAEHADPYAVAVRYDTGHHAGRDRVIRVLSALEYQLH